MLGLMGLLPCLEVRMITDFSKMFCFFKALICTTWPHALVNILLGVGKALKRASLHPHDIKSFERGDHGHMT